jgi:integrase
MTASNSTPRAKPSKPPKPSPEFPLFAHASGRWAKKIRGRFHYFGPWGDPDGALARYNAEKENLHAGRVPEPEDDLLTVYKLAAKFLTTKKLQRDAGELTAGTFEDYGKVCRHLVRMLGRNRAVADLRADDFEKLKARMLKNGWSTLTIANTINKVKTVFNYAFKSGLIDRPMVYGEGFKRPTRRQLRKQRRERGPKLFSAGEIRAMLAQAGPQLRAMILLGASCGLGNTDCANLRDQVLDLDAGWLTYPRPKTEAPRRAWLWPEVVAAIRAAIAARPEPKDPRDAGLVFLTRLGQPWSRHLGSISHEFTKLLRKIAVGRAGLSFYTLRHVFRTVADECRDQPAIDLMMGHESGAMANVYRETISDERIRAVSEHVRAWLFGTGNVAEAGARVVD